MSWLEPFEFTSSYPLTPSRNPSPDPYDRIPSLERDYCSNFTCCGLHLSDLHSLLDHFETSHVVIIDDAGNPVIPRTESWDDFDNFQSSGSQSDLVTYPHMNLVFGYPQIDIQPFENAPHQPQVVSHGHFVVESPTPSVYYPPHTLLQLDHDYSPADLVHLDASSPEHDICSPISEGSPGLPPSSFAEETPYRRRPVSSYRGSHKSKAMGPKPRPFPRKRERAHKCPTFGCSKSYLNPNGLKYHVEKGTCRIDLD